MLIGCRLGTEALYLVPEDWSATWIRNGGRILREATSDEGKASEPVLLVRSSVLVNTAVQSRTVALGPQAPQVEELRADLLQPNIVSRGRRIKARD